MVKATLGGIRKGFFMNSDNTPTTREYEIENGEIQTTLEAVSDLLTHLLPNGWSHSLLLVGPASGAGLQNQRQVFAGLRANDDLDGKAISEILMRLSKEAAAKAKED